MEIYWYIDLLYFGSYNDKNELETFRYTQNQRRLETRNKKYNKLQDKINKETKINNKSVKEIETELSNNSSKSSNYNKFLEYCKKKNETNRLLFSHYKQKVFRKLKFNRYTNTQKSESKMIKNFKNKFGKPNECTIILGDYDKGDGHMKGKESLLEFYKTQVSNQRLEVMIPSPYIKTNIFYLYISF